MIRNPPSQLNPLLRSISAYFSRYAREITAVLIIKAIGLGLLWFIFFRQPTLPQVGQRSDALRNQIFGPTSGFPPLPK